MNKPIIVFLATSWGTKNGGINVFNTGLALNMGRRSHGKVEVVCIAVAPTKAQVREAAQYKVTLIALPEPLSAKEATDAVRLRFPGKEVQWWIGHDIHTGDLARLCRNISRQGHWAMVIHCDYLSFEGIKGSSGNTTEQKSKHQRNLVQAADRVFAVGPKLAGRARGMGSKLPVVTLVPGLEKHNEQSTGQFSAITIGRFGPTIGNLKQHNLAAAAFGKAANIISKTSTDPTLRIIGIEEGDAQAEQVAKKLAAHYAGAFVNVVASAFVENRKELLELVAQNYAFMMLSLHEGFGLTGWEAIGCSVPLILSKNSGLYELIEKTGRGEGKGWVHAIDLRGPAQNSLVNEDDVEAVASALLRIWARGEEAKNDAKYLRSHLGKYYSWSKTHSSCVQALGLP